MSSEVSAVEKVLQAYFDGLYEGDTKKLGEVFHLARISMPRAVTARQRLAAARVQDGGRSAVRQGQGSARADRIVSIDFSGPTTAIAKVECQLPPRYFTEYLTLLKVDGRWQIISKTFHTVTKE
jgi:hypothetical protein